MTLELTQDNALTAALHEALGQTVDYVGSVVGSLSDVVLIIDDGDAEFPGSFDATAADADAVARVQRSVVANPRRGDTITDANSLVYTVDDYRVWPDSQGEWLMELKRG